MSQEEVYQYIRTIKDGTWDDRIRAASALAEIGAPAVPALTATLRDGTMPVRWITVETLVRVGDSSSVPALCEALQDPEWIVRRNAAVALGNIGDEAAIPALAGALKDRDGWVRRYAGEALIRMGSPAALIALLRHREEEYHPYAYEALLQAGASAVPALVQALPGCNRDVRRIVCELLGKIGDASAVPALIHALKDEDARVQREAAGALERMGDARTLPRRVLAAQQLPPAEKIAALEEMRAVRYSDAVRTIFYEVHTDLYRFCQTVQSETDAEARIGAQAVLDYLSHVRPTERDPSSDPQVLVRPAQGVHTSDTGTLLRPADGPPDAAEPDSSPQEVRR
jgi:HEAT repeat protein